jgi:hypothetical protein
MAGELGLYSINREDVSVRVKMRPYNVTAK